MRGNTGNWFKSYLQNRKQFCSVNGQRSLASEVACGIPQGSCLGPLLFIIYLNDFEKFLEFSRASVYADDTTIRIVSNDVEKLPCETQQELLNLSEWMRINKLHSGLASGHLGFYQLFQNEWKLKYSESPIKSVSENSLICLLTSNISQDIAI